MEEVGLLFRGLEFVGTPLSDTISAGFLVTRIRPVAYLSTC